MGPIMGNYVKLHLFMFGKKETFKTFKKIPGCAQNYINCCKFGAIKKNLTQQ